MEQSRPATVRSWAGSLAQLSIGVEERRSESTIRRVATRSFWVQEGASIFVGRFAPTRTRLGTERAKVIRGVTTNGVVFKHGYQMGKAAEEHTTKRRRFVEKRGEHSWYSQLKAQRFEYLHSSEFEDATIKERQVEHAIGAALGPQRSQSHEEIHLDDSKLIKRSIDAESIFAIRSHKQQIRPTTEQGHISLRWKHSYVEPKQTNANCWENKYS